MPEPSLELQRAIVDALKASGAVQAVAGSRVYDRVPTSPVFPYATVGEGQLIDDGNSCGPAWEAFATIHAWSRAVGMPEVKRLSSAIHDALDTELTLTGGFRIVEGHHRDTVFLDDPDLLTSHAVLTFQYLIDPEA